MSRVLRSVASLGVGVGLAVTTACGGAPAPPRPRTALYRAPSVTTEPAPRAPRAPVEGVSWAADEPEAAFVALERQAHALFARPHPLRLAEVVVPDTALYRQWDARLRALSRAGRAERQPGSTLVDVQVTTDTPEIVYLRVTYHDTVQETLDRAGTVIAVEPMAPTSHWVVVMQRDRTAGIARWRFVAIDRSVRDLEISL